MPARKDADRLGAWDPDGIVQVALRDLRDEVGDDMVLMADLCLDEYTDHGHCGVLTATGEVDNDATIELLRARSRVAQADAGADVVAPSGMMDGQVVAIRDALDERRSRATSRSSPTAAKYASALYGPFRDAVDVRDRRRRRPQGLPAGSGATRARRWRRCAPTSTEGADMVMVKPALAYLDVIAACARRGRRARRRVPRVGRVLDDQGGRRAGWIDGDAVAIEHLTADQAGRRRRDPHLPRPARLAESARA